MGGSHIVELLDWIDGEHGVADPIGDRPREAARPAAEIQNIAVPWIEAVVKEGQ